MLGAILINLAASYLSGYMPFVWQLLLGVTFIVVILLLRGLLPLLLGRNGARRRDRAGADRQAAAGRRGGLSLRGVAKRFGSLQVLEGIDLKAGGGELLGLIGPNGAGKTTLMRCIADGAERSAGGRSSCAAGPYGARGRRSACAPGWAASSRTPTSSTA